MSIPIFLSYPKPYEKRQENFIETICDQLSERGFAPKTLGVTEYDMKAPLTAIRRLMLESNGIITVAFRRAYVEKGKSKPKHKTDEKNIDNSWLTSPYSHIEPAMAFQLGLPVLILRENGVIADGLLEKGALGLYMPEFDLGKTMPPYLVSDEWTQIFAEWECQVRTVRQNKGTPPLLY